MTTSSTAGPPAAGSSITALDDAGPSAAALDAARPATRMLRLGPLQVPLGLRSLVVALVLVGVCLVAVVLALTVGDLGIPPAELPGVLAGGGSKVQHWSVFDNRLPRVLSALGAGAAFGMSGALFQSVTRNPLGSPDIIGLSSGAGAGAAVTSMMFTAVPLPVGALIGALVAVVIVIGGSGGGLGAPYKMVVIGIGVSAVAVAVVQFVVARVEADRAMALAAWITGSLQARNAGHVRFIVLALVVVGGLTLLTSRGLQAVEMGDDVARGIGVNPSRVRIAAVGLGVLLAVAAVVVAGPIAFIALVAPQIGRRLTRATGPGLAVAALTGAALLALADVLAQHVLASPVPVGIATAALGGVYLAFLLMHEWRRGTV